MRMRILGLSLALLFGITLSTPAATLSIGDPAPPITVSKWVKGEKHDKLEPEQTYVVEFWATWCGPCRVSIPHLTELQKKFKDKGVAFLGISVWESDQAEVEPFVKEMGDKMVYSVAMDDVPKDGKGDEGKMALAWMSASESNGIPTAFIVKTGKVAWIGHPSELEEPLTKVVEGKWDIAAAASKYQEEKALNKKLMGVITKLNKFLQEEKPKEALGVLNEAFADNAQLEDRLGGLKFKLLLASKETKQASEYGTKLVEGSLRDNANGLNAIAWMIVDPESDQPADKRDLALARKAAERANILTKDENAAVLDTLAKVYFDSGLQSRAVEIQEKAVRLTKSEVKEMNDRLEQYKKAVEKEKNAEKK